MSFKTMRFRNLRPNKHLIVGLTAAAATAIAMIALVAATVSQAAQIGNFAAGPRAPAMAVIG